LTSNYIETIQLVTETVAQTFCRNSVNRYRPIYTKLVKKL